MSPVAFHQSLNQNVRGHTLRMDPQTIAFLEKVAAASPGLASIWLIGSRANGTATAASDWDFIAFGTSATLQFLRQTTALHRANTDFFVVTNGEDFEAAWGELDKTGCLTEWQWRNLSESESEYMQSRRGGFKDGSRVLVTRGLAVRVWPRSRSAL